jgi:uncharacterized membrane protein required for colicin V production
MEAALKMAQATFTDMVDIPLLKLFFKTKNTSSTCVFLFSFSSSWVSFVVLEKFLENVGEVLGGEVIGGVFGLLMPFPVVAVVFVFVSLYVPISICW